MGLTDGLHIPPISLREMSEDCNSLGQPIGPAVPNWSRRTGPPRTPMMGRFCRLERLDVERHVADLWAANSLDCEARMWTYLPWGPFRSFDEYLAYMQTVAPKEDPLIHAVIDIDTDKAVGVASYLRVNADAGTIEVGGLAYSPLLQRRPAATEAMYLMMRRVFDELGYRRYEWKCNALNAPSRAAATRLGFQFEGIFRQADRQGPQPRHSVVCDYRPRMAGIARGVRARARSRQFRREWPAARQLVVIDQRIG